MVGHTIPGKLRKYPTRTVNYADYSTAVDHRRSVDPVLRMEDQPQVPSNRERKVRPQNMHGPLTKEHPMTEMMRRLLEKRGPKMREGYEPVREDLSWRGQPTSGAGQAPPAGPGR